jgi:hypothetical protein
MAMTLTCLSCSHYRTTGCQLGQSGWPAEHLNDCWAAQWEPGSDEAEDWDQNEPDRGDSAGTMTSEEP